MKHITTLLVCLLLYGTHAAAQSADSSILLFIDDPSVLSHVTQNQDGTVTPVFTNAGINSIISNYTITVFEQAYTASRFPFMHKYYRVIASSNYIGAELHNSFPDIFPDYQVQGANHITGVYTPSDFNDVVAPNPGYTSQVFTWYLDYIRARDAWGSGITGCQGDTSVIIGVTDNGFFLNYNDGHGAENNPDLVSKVVMLDNNHRFPDFSDHQPGHGTLVAGLAAGATDNGIGYPAVGFNCRLELSDSMEHSMLLYLATRKGIRVLNASWTDNNETDVVDINGYVVAQHLYDEIYENGSITCFGAGNSSATPWKFMYPASLDHNISVTNVNGETCHWVIGVPCNDSTLPCECDRHNIYADTTGSPNTEYHHNIRVDICAPSVRVGGLTWDTTGHARGSDARYYGQTQGWGTSFGSPLVAGTIGLMLSVNKWLSPYQVEYALKMSSRDIYSEGITANDYLFHIDRFHSRAGAGALDAEAAVRFVNPEPSATPHFDVNNPATQTFFIKGIELNTICAPGFATDSVKPKLVPVYENGRPPYRFLWSPYADNKVTLDNYHTERPTVMTSTGTRLLHMRLAIYDSSLIEKVASRDIRIRLSSSNTPIVGMRDAYLDMLDEPDSMWYADPWEFNIWESPDIWNRKHNDGITDPEDIEYFSSGAPNYMYVRIRNVGCADYVPSLLTSVRARLHAYWTLASTGENWSTDWTTGMIPGAAPGSFVPTGAEITNTLYVPTLHPGDTFVTAIPWNPPNPADYATGLTTMDICGLARLEHLIDFPESTIVKDNIWKNRAIATRNMTEVNLGHRLAPPIHRVYVANAGTAPQTFSIQMLTDRDTYKYLAGNLSEYMQVGIKLQPELYGLWYNAGRYGSYASLSPNDSIIYYDPATPLRLDSITLDTGMKYYADLTFLTRSVPITTRVRHEIQFRQLTADSAGNEIVYGNMSYMMRIHADATSPKGVLTVTEVATGPTTGCEYARIIVSNCDTGTSPTVDVRGWIIDDNSGNFNITGCTAYAGITQGHYRLAYDNIWKDVPVGSAIIVYNADSNCYSMPDSFAVTAVGDTTLFHPGSGGIDGTGGGSGGDSSWSGLDVDGVTGNIYWLPVGSSGGLHQLGHTHMQRFIYQLDSAACSYIVDTLTSDSTSDSSWYAAASDWENTIALDPAGDAFQVRCPRCGRHAGSSPAFYHGIGYGDSTFTGIPPDSSCLGGTVFHHTGHGYRFTFIGSSVADLSDSTMWQVSGCFPAGRPPMELGSGGVPLRGTLPCCSDVSSGPRSEGRMANNGSSGKTGNSNSRNNQQQARNKVQSLQGFSVYPIPAIMTLNFRYTLQDNITIRISDITGRIMEEQVLPNSTGTSFNVAGYAPGIYMYQVITSDKTQSGKVVIEK